MSCPISTFSNNTMTEPVLDQTQFEGNLAGRVVTENPELIKRPNLMVLTCNYGSGHNMASQGIVERLPEYHVQVVDLYDTALRPLDPLRSFSSDWSSDKFYNTMAKMQFNRITNVISKIVGKSLLFQREKIESLLKSYIAEHKPDMIISCIPLIDSMLLDAAKFHNIPLLVVTTDIDISDFCRGFNDEQLVDDKKKFQISVPFATEEWKEKFAGRFSEALQGSFNYGFGYPTRKAFSEVANETTLGEIRQNYDIKDDENIILVMMGGNTAQAAVSYAKLLLGMTNNEIRHITGNMERDKIHLICLCGNVKEKSNNNLMTELNKLNKSFIRNNKLVRVQGCAGTPKIAELVSLPELCTVISKPGGSTVNEMIKKKVPMVYHVSDAPFDWECGNMEYGEIRNFGKRFKKEFCDCKVAARFAKVLIYTMSLRKKMLEDTSLVPEAEADFTTNLRNTVKFMLNEE